LGEEDGYDPEFNLRDSGQFEVGHVPLKPHFPGFVVLHNNDRNLSACGVNQHPAMVGINLYGQ
jgi:hypothetical protein